MVRVHCPVSANVLARLQAGEAAALADDALLNAVVEVIRGGDVLGAIGPYRGVFELGFGLESFVPQADAAPTTGRAGEAAVVPTVVVKSYAAEGADIAAELAAIVAAHPWEVPVIEVGVVGLVTA
ncbi:hypothetical protein ASE65_04930 [Sphingomonas sp. Leaf16]|nr:hypothetical protein ASE65_04930 [Sphingomonas sp. Leaf16]KQN13878.1 hypothetical protein ASE81_05000 [Sphingomonas sp. Leaf29]KQN23863.1 hypothetical protein ASE83_00410 [Sphingomonas sp. Leaf32]